MSAVACPCNAKLGLCRCERNPMAHALAVTVPHQCKCGCTWHDGDAGVQFGTNPVQPAVRKP